MKICVTGIWHLGAVTSVCLADLGYTVTGHDPDVLKVELLNGGHPPIYEPGLEELLIANQAAGRLSYTADLSEALQGAAYVFITHDTPVDERDEVDVSGVLQTVATLALFVEDGATIVVSSQVPVGTCEDLAASIRQVNPSLNFGIAYVPENLRLGQAIDRFKHPDMIVVGADNPSTLAKVRHVFSVFEASILAVDLRTAEMTKHAINAYLAMCISFANELANISDTVGADALKVIEGLRRDSRVSQAAPLFPGLGFAGGTLARDLRILQRLGQEQNHETPLVNGILRVNERQNSAVVERLEQALGSLDGLTIGVLGLTYKPGTSTLRRSSAIEMIQVMSGAGARVKAFDPKADPTEVEAHVGSFRRCDSPYDVAEESDALVLVTPWPEFKKLDWSRLRAAMKTPFLLDAQNMLDADEMSDIGFHYQGVGRGRARKLEKASS